MAARTVYDCDRCGKRVSSTEYLTLNAERVDLCEACAFASLRRISHLINGGMLAEMREGFRDYREKIKYNPT